MILVTGANGVIGRDFVARLRDESVPHVSLSRAVFDLAGDAPLSACVGRRPSTVIHLAAAVPKPPKISDDESSAARTRRMDRKILEAVREWRCAVIYVSGCSLYERRDEPLDEGAAVVAQDSPYLAAKLGGEREFLAYENATVLRVSAPLGEGLPAAAVAMRFVLAARSGGEIPVWGSGAREQNYVDTDDIADALWRALIVRPNTLINIAADEPVTMLELATEVASACGTGRVHLTGQADPNDGYRARYSNLRAAELLGWRPRATLRETLNRLARTAP